MNREVTTFSIKFYAHNSPSYFQQNDAQLGNNLFESFAKFIAIHFQPIIDFANYSIIDVWSMSFQNKI
ncbi:MAG: hypothetical protein UZ08_BCD001001970 [Candidatus Parvibacillus calidus]|nr:MAG: hypothetical protein UZ08_BCD001001970 [Candidatus Parvibacillus calidus]